MTPPACGTTDGHLRRDRRVGARSLEAVFTLLDPGGDYADGVIARRGRWPGGTILVSLGRKTAALLFRHGEAARRLS
jgi:hypothetical protein